MIRARSWTALGAIVFLGAGLLACGGEQGPQAQETLNLAAASAATGVVWSVQESGGGTVSGTGLYSAPGTAGTYHVVVRSTADSSKTATAVITVSAPTDPPPPPPPPPPSSGLAACASEPLRTTGKTYYVCDCQSGASSGCVAGNDSNAGTSDTAPKKTLGAAKSLFQSMNAGDTVAFCKGGRWSSGAWGGTSNGKCSASSTCDVRSYSPPWGGNGARPYFTYDGSGSGFFDFTSGSATGGYRFQGLEFHGSGSNAGVFVYNGTSNVLFCDDVFQGFQLGLQVWYSPNVSSNVHLVSSQILSNTQMGYLGGSVNGQILYNTFRENGSDNNGRDHNIYLNTEPPTSIGGMLVKGNKLSRAGGVGGHVCNSVELVVHGMLPNLVLDGNVIDETGDAPPPSCYGISVNPDGETASQAGFTNLQVRNNIVRNISGVGINVQSAPSFVIENNLVTLRPTSSSDATGISVKAGQGASSKDLVNSNGRIRNNTIYAASIPGGAYANGIGGDGLGGGEKYNNAVWFGGGSGSCEPVSGANYSSNEACTTSGSSSWFVAPGSNFAPSPGGSLAGAGTTRSGAAPTTDITGAARPNPPAIGAYD